LIHQQIDRSIDRYTHQLGTNMINVWDFWKVVFSFHVFFDRYREGIIARFVSCPIDSPRFTQKLHLWLRNVSRLTNQWSLQSNPEWYWLIVVSNHHFCGFKSTFTTFLIDIDMMPELVMVETQKKCDFIHIYMYIFIYLPFFQLKWTNPIFVRFVPV
jgi:hypothetical protein